MSLTKLKKDKKIKPKTEKKLAKLINESDSGSESEHELSFYLNDRVKLMKEVIRILKPKKIKTMAPTCIKNLNNEEISSMLLEELLGISNKRLKRIFSGQLQDDDTSSTEEEEDQPPDVISLDDVTDDEFVIDLDLDDDESNKKQKKKGKVKEESKEKKTRIKKENTEKSNSKYKDGIMDATSEGHLMSVLELLELQARARAIRSQLALENSKKSQEVLQEDKNHKNDVNSDADDAIIIESPENEEIVITSSESENEKTESDITENKNTNRNQQNTECNEKYNSCTTDKAVTDSTEVSRLEKINHDDIEYISNYPSEESSTSKIDYIPDNPEEINKLLNKFHKMKRKKRKSANEEKHKHEKCIMDKSKHKAQTVDIYESKTVIKNNLSGSVNELTKPYKDTTILPKIQKLEVDKENPHVKSNEVTQRNIFVNNEVNEDIDGDDGIILTVDPVEMDSINLEPEFAKESANHIKIIVNEMVKPAQMGNQKENVDRIVGKRKMSSNNDEINDKKMMKIEKEGKGIIEDSESIILNVDQSELDSINLD